MGRSGVIPQSHMFGKALNLGTDLFLTQQQFSSVLLDIFGDGSVQPLVLKFRTHYDAHII